MVDIIGLLLYNLPIKSQEVSMSTKLNLLKILNNNTTSYLSGQDLAAQAGTFKKFHMEGHKNASKRRF